MKLFNSIILSFTLAVLLCGTSTRAQQVEIKWGPAIKFDYRFQHATVVGEDEEFYYAIRTLAATSSLQMRELLFEKYTKGHELVQSQKLSLKDSAGMYCIFENMYQVDDRFILVLSRYYSRTDIKHLYVSSVDKMGNQGKPVLIDKQFGKTEKQAGSYAFTLSEDKTKLLVTHTSQLLKDDRYIMLKSNLEPLWEKDIVIPYKNDEFINQSYVIDEVGNVYTLGYIKNSGDEFVQYSVLGYDYKNDKLSELKAEFGKAIFVNKLELMYNQGQLYLVGFYFNEPSGLFSSATIKGTVYKRINPNTFEIEAQKVEEFDPITLSKFGIVNDKGDKGIKSAYKIKHVICRENSVIQLVSENAYVKTYRSQDNLVRYEYFNRDMLVIQLNKSGNIEWASRIPKNQTGDERCVRYTSFVLTSDKYGLYLVYNDSHGNAFTEEAKGMLEYENPVKINLDKPENAVLMVAIVDRAGVVTRMPYPMVEDDKSIVFESAGYVKMKNGVVWLKREHKKYQKFGFLTVRSNY